MRTVEERLKSYEPLWENWTYTGEFLGEGAMSSVFEIQSTAMGMRELAALKIITVKKNFLGEVKIPENALNEIKILRTLSGCQNIVQYHDSTQRQIFDSNNVLTEIDILIKMEKLKPLSEGDKMDPDQVIKLAKDMCNALAHACEHGIIHRDIKPQNIFVDKEGTYKLGDFGIAKIVSDFTQNYTMNIGTMAYTAPEVYRNSTGVYDISSDIYSLGLVLYVFLNDGYLPFVSNASSLHDAIAKRLSGAPFPSPSKGSKNLKAIVMRACNNDLKKRYKNPKEMLEDLELLSTGGKKLVADPFATLDANIDVNESESYGAEVKSGGSGGDFSGVSITASHESKKDSAKGTGGSRVMINMKGSTGAKSPVYDKGKLSSDGESASLGNGSRIMINMGGKTSKSSFVVPESPKVNPVKSIESDKRTEEDTREKSFFSTPDSI